MAMISCAECGRSISDKAHVCVGCGAPINLKESQTEEETLSKKIASSVEQENIHYGLITKIYLQTDFAFDITDKFGNRHLVNRDAEFSSEIDSNKKISDMKEGDIIVFELEYNNDALSKITEKDLPNDLRISLIFKEFNGTIVRNSTSYSLLLKNEGKNVSENLNNAGDIKEAVDNKDKDTKPSNLKYIVIGAILATAVGYWLVKGSPDVDVMFSSAEIEQQCLKFVKKNQGKLWYDANKEISLNTSWIKEGRRVVEFHQKIEGDASQITTIICVYGKGTIEIPNLFRQGNWR